MIRTIEIKLDDVDGHTKATVKGESKIGDLLVAASALTIGAVENSPECPEEMASYLREFSGQLNRAGQALNGFAAGRVRYEKNSD